MLVGIYLPSSQKPMGYLWSKVEVPQDTADRSLVYVGRSMEKTERHFLSSYMPADNVGQGSSFI